MPRERERIFEFEGAPIRWHSRTVCTTAAYSHSWRMRAIHDDTSRLMTAQQTCAFASLHPSLRFLRWTTMICVEQSTSGVSLTGFSLCVDFLIPRNSNFKSLFLSSKIRYSKTTMLKREIGRLVTSVSAIVYGINFIKFCLKMAR